MKSNGSLWTAYGPTTLFVLLWGSGAIFSRWGLDHASPFVLLSLRFALAGGSLAALGLLRGEEWLPAPGTRLRVALIGLPLIGGYTACYFLALAHGITPGVLATVCGAQPILTLAWLEPGAHPRRLSGLALALGGLALVVGQGIAAAHFSAAGMLSALGALACMTVGAILQKGIAQTPAQVLPLQYGISLLLCLALLPAQPVALEPGIGLLLPLLWLGLVISVGAQLLLYRMIRGGNLVNVTSLFYLVPGVTAAMDFLLLGNRMSASSLAGMAIILCGLYLVMRAPVAVAR